MGGEQEGSGRPRERQRNARKEKREEMKGGGEGTLETANTYWWRGGESESGVGGEKREINKPDASFGGGILQLSPGLV